MLNRRRIDLILEREIIEAMGCTEPAAAALAGAKAAELFGMKPERGVAVVSPNMMKNAMGVSIPNSSLHGIKAAVTLGITIHDSSAGLSVLSTVTDKERMEAQSFPLDVEIDENAPSLYVKVTVYGAGHSASAVISGEHDRFTSLELDGRPLPEAPMFFPECKSFSEDDFLATLTIGDVLEYASNLSVVIKDLLRKAVAENKAISKAGLTEEWGLSVGRLMGQTVKDPPSSLDEAMRKAAAAAAAGSDARMAGSVLPVMINSGSGNQGITVTVPVAVVAEYLGKDEEEMLSAVSISELIGIILTSHKDRLSALCGAFTASIGTACAYAWLLGCDSTVLDATINNMVGNLSGIICDGAKDTCALKIYSSLIAASIAVELAMKGKRAGGEAGIVGDDSLASIDHLTRISHEGMEQTNRTILQIMLEKTKSGS
ncbi:MAG: serine dehydratase subunit alpha family protein [Spirochaetes bacterium]|uniref:UPF0597 protein IAA97_04545 n=1 Tax=Candidatus Ornithospirochaeta stercoripullorum TaxID=2840899 RepID=A0A9D9E031_9SPIO|nr:serine dehydratase subunit alpha family protein [Candidatus Ornithospirochaeta stercoripullorum]